MDKTRIKQIQHLQFAFQHVWRFSGRGQLTAGYPAEYKNQFRIEADKIDAALERSTDNHLVFFTGTIVHVLQLFCSSRCQGTPRIFSFHYNLVLVVRIICYTTVMDFQCIVQDYFIFIRQYGIVCE